MAAEYHFNMSSSHNRGLLELTDEAGKKQTEIKHASGLSKI